MIGRKSLLPLANVVIGATLGLLALKVTAVYFGREAYGQMEAALAILGILYLFADLNMGEAHVKRVSEGLHAGDCFATFAIFRLVTSLLFIAVSVGALFLYTVVLGRTIEDTTAPALLFALLYYIGKSAQNVAQSTFEARLEVARGQLGALVETIVRVGLTLVAALGFTALVHRSGPLYGRISGDSPVWAWIAANPSGVLAAAYAAGAFAAALVTGYYLFRVLERGRFRWALLGSYYRFALPLFALSAAGLISLFIDRAMLAFFGTSLDTADFAGPRRVVTVIEGIGAAIGLLLFPAFSVMTSTGAHAAAATLLNKSIRYLSMLLMPVSAFLMFFPVPVIRLVLGDEWAGNGMTLSILAFWVLLHTVSRPQMNLIMGSGRSGLAARIGLTVAAINITLNLVLIPDDIKSLGITLFGLKALGAALATLVAGTISFAMLSYSTHAVLGIKSKSIHLKHVTASAAMVAVLWLIDTQTAFHLGRWYTIVAYVLIGALAYGLSLIALRELTRDDWVYVQDILHPGEMWHYIRSELFRR